MNRRPQPDSNNTEMAKRSKTKTKKSKEKRSVGDEEEEEELKNLHDFQNSDDQVKVFRPASHIIPNARKDLYNIALLLFLYFLQGVPLGLTSSLPFILR